MSATSLDLESWITSLMLKKGITNYKLDLSGSTTKGDGYLGEVNFVKVIARPGKGKEKNYHLVVKSAKKSEEFRKQTPIREAFEREIFMYTKVLPILREFQMEYARQEKPFEMFPKCYSSCSENQREAVILKNLKPAGYEIHDRTVPQNLNHALFVFQNYGRFHALSLALRKKKPALFKSLTKNMTDVMGKFISQAKMVPNFATTFTNGVNQLDKDVARKFDGFEDQIGEYLSSHGNENSPQSVILHGDCWNNNMMFKYEGGNKNHPIDMCFIDFQLSRVASPVYDLSYYLYSCADKSVLDNFDFLLQAYYSSLSDSLKDFGCDPDDILTFKELTSHWRKYGKFGLSMAPFIIRIELCESDEVVDIAESAEKGGLSDAFFDFKLKQEDVYVKRVVDVLSHFGEKFL